MEYQWIEIKHEMPKEDELVLLTVAGTRMAVIGCWVSGDDDESWSWAGLDGNIFFDKNGKIDGDCLSDDYPEFTHFCRLPQQLDL